MWRLNVVAFAVAMKLTKKTGIAVPSLQISFRLSAFCFQLSYFSVHLRLSFIFIPKIKLYRGDCF